jgi:hypothetical protein
VGYAPSSALTLCVRHDRPGSEMIVYRNFIYYILESTHDERGFLKKTKEAISSLVGAVLYALFLWMLSRLKSLLVGARGMLALAFVNTSPQAVGLSLSALNLFAALLLWQSV